jgi:hypothetical protein
MRLLLSLLNLNLFLLIPVALLAGPVLVCDPYPVSELQPTKFVVTVNGSPVDVFPEHLPDGSSYLRHDLGSLADDIYTVKVKAVNTVVNLESSEVSISFRKTGSQVTRVKDDAEKLPASRSYKGYIRDER